MPLQLRMLLCIPSFPTTTLTPHLVDNNLRPKLNYLTKEVLREGGRQIEGDKEGQHGPP